MKSAPKLGNLGAIAIAVLAMDNTASAQTCAVELGCEVTASGDYSTAMGRNNEASGDYSTVFGQECIAGGSYSVVGGFHAWASGSESVALGAVVGASGENSVVIGHGSVAIGDESTAMGYYTLATAYNSTTMGRHTVSQGDPDSWVETDPLLEIGNGAHSSTPHNALTILKNGNVGIDTADPAFRLQITGGSDAEPDGGGYLVIGDHTAANIVIDNNEIMARNNGVTSPLYLQNDGGSVRVGGTVVHSSDRRLKDNITALHYGLAEVLRLQPVSYDWKGRPQNGRSLGFIAQDVQEVLPELVSEDDDSMGTLSVNYTGVVPVLVTAVQQLARSNDELVDENAHLRRDFKAQATELIEKVTAYRSELNQLKAEMTELRALVANRVVQSLR